MHFFLFTVIAGDTSEDGRTATNGTQRSEKPAGSNSGSEVKEGKRFPIPKAARLKGFSIQQKQEMCVTVFASKQSKFLHLCEGLKA